jgi:hypothetical protein
MQKYKIIRNYIVGDTHVIRKNYTLDQAIEHCNDIESSWLSCKNPINIALTESCGAWFDTYTEQEDSDENNI